MLSAAARRACSALAAKLLREASKSSPVSAPTATGRALLSPSSSSTSASTSSSAPSPSSPGIEFSGGVRVPHTTTLAFVGGAGYGTSGALHPDLLAAVASEARGGGGGEAAAAAARRFAARPLPAYWTIDFAGNDVGTASAADVDADDGRGDGDDDLDEGRAVALYSSIARLQALDAVFYEAQRQGRFAFYMTSAGEEATAVGSAAALKTSDPVFAQYREQGVLLHRGFSFADFANQCFGNELEPGRGRQMPIHYGSKKLAFHTISSPLATQLPQAVGAAYALSREQSGRGLGERNVAVAYFGDGASSEGDFHAAANFAAVLAGRGGPDGGGDAAAAAGGTPLLLICRNNGWAISTPTTEQYAGDGIAGRGPAYGIPSIRVDGGDARAVWRATKRAREIALRRRGPVLIECIAYRAGHHSTSDDASRYRGGADASAALLRDPGARFAAWLRTRGWWDDGREQALRRSSRKEAVAALGAAEKVPRARLSSMFEDVYDKVPAHLAEQREKAVEFAARHGEVLPSGVRAE